MNRRGKRFAEHRGIGTDTASKFSREILDSAHLSQEMQQLIRIASDRISFILTEIYRPTFPLKPSEVVVALVNYESPIASPDLKRSPEKIFATTQLKRAGLAAALSAEPAFINIVHDLEKPQKCGDKNHVDLFVSTKNGALLHCAECDHGFKRETVQKVGEA